MLLENKTAVSYGAGGAVGGAVARLRPRRGKAERVRERAALMRTRWRRARLLPSPAVW